MKAVRLVLCVLLFVGAAQAQDLPAEGSTLLDAAILAASQTPKSPPALPSSNDLNAALLINSSNVADFKSLIVPELYPLVHAGILEIQALDQLAYNPGQIAAVDSRAELGPQGDLRESFKLGQGFLFGGKEQIVKSPGAAVAHKILWNTQSRWAMQPYFETELILDSSKESRNGRLIRAELVRVFPRAISPDDRSVQFFRERLRISAPEVIAKSGWLTFRFAGLDDDAVWVYSPAIRQFREVTGSNRSDDLYHSSLSLDDLLVWSGKPEGLDAALERSTAGLVPFSRLQESLAVSSGECREVQEVQVSSEGQEGLSSAPQESGVLRRTSGGVTLPASTVFVPRELWRLDLGSRDPYAFYGRQVLYVDTQTMLPMYKAVYNRAGHAWKFIVGAYGFARDSSGQKVFAYPSWTVIDDKLKNELWLVNYKRTRVCDSLPGGMQLTDFDPKKLGPPVEVPKEEATGTPRP